MCCPIKCGSGDKIPQGAPPAEEMTDISDCFIRTSLPLCLGTHGQSSFPINHPILTTDRPKRFVETGSKTPTLVALRTMYPARAILMSQTNHTQAEHLVNISETMAGNMTEALRRTLGCEKDPETLLYLKRIEETDNRFKALGHWVKKYALGIDKLAHKGENICSSLGACSSHLQSNDDQKNHLSNYLVHLSTVQQQRTELKEVLHDKISSDILAYERKCQELRKSVKSCEDVLRKKNHRLSELQKAKTRTPVDPRRINEANIKFEQARCQADRSREDVKIEMKHFEEQKIEDLNRILGDFLIAEMRFHAQALQEYTAAFRCLPLLSDDEDDDYSQGSRREKTRGTKDRKIAFTSSTETVPSGSGSICRRRSDSNDSKLSIGDLY